MCESKSAPRKGEMSRGLKIARIGELLERAAFLNERIEEIDKGRRLLAYDGCCNIRGCMREPERIPDHFLDSYLMDVSMCVERMGWILDEIVPKLETPA